MTRDHNRPNCLLECLPNCLSPTREGFLSPSKINPAARVIARQVRGKICLAAIFAPRHQDIVSSGPLGCFFRFLCFLCLAIFLAFFSALFPSFFKDSQGFAEREMLALFGPSFLFVFWGQKKSKDWRVRVAWVAISAFRFRFFFGGGGFP